VVKTKLIFWSKLLEDKHLEAVNAFNDRIKTQKENNTDLLATDIAINEEDKKSKTPSASKKAQQKLSNRKNSISGLNPDDIQAHFNSTFYASYILSHLSKTLCVSAALLTKKQPFEHVGNLSANVITIKPLTLYSSEMISASFTFIRIDMWKVLSASSLGDGFAKR